MLQLSDLTLIQCYRVWLLGMQTWLHRPCIRVVFACSDLQNQKSCIVNWNPFISKAWKKMCSWYLTHELHDNLWRGVLTCYTSTCALAYSSACTNNIVVFNSCSQLGKGSGFPFWSASTTSRNILACACLNSQVLALENSATDKDVELNK